MIGIRIAFVCLLALFLSPVGPTGRVGAAESKGAGAGGAGKRVVTGRVVETMDAGNYTYVRIQEGDQKTWVAAMRFKVEVGDTVAVPDYFLMKDFSSRTLNKTFDTILFAGKVHVKGKGDTAAGALPEGHPPIAAGSGAGAGSLPEGHPGIETAAARSVEVKKGSIDRVKGGQTVEECFAKQKALAGKKAKVRGVVVKFNADIMGKNWLHLKDGTGEKGTDDLTVTTKETVQVGERVVVTGQMSYNKDFGAGYSYKAIMEDAVVEREKAKP